MKVGERKVTCNEIPEYQSVHTANKFVKAGRKHGRETKPVISPRFELRESM
jgi:hypothetical protein